jgi:hypothetical protein
LTTRTERVVLELDDRFSTKMAKAAAATALLDGALHDLDGSSVDTGRSVDNATHNVENLGRATNETTTATTAGTRATKEYTLAQALADERARQLRSSLRSQAREMIGGSQQWEVYGDHVKQYSLEAAIGEERARRLNAALRDQASAAVDAEQGISNLDNSVRDVDRNSHLLIKSALALGPALVPIGALAVPAVSGLASELGFAAVGMGSLLVAAQGVANAVQLVNKAALAPTVENLQKAQAALGNLAPAAQVFVSRLNELKPVLVEMRNAAASGWFPGLTDALDSFERVAPMFEGILHAVGQAGGNLVAEAANALNSAQWRAFEEFLIREAPPALEALGHSVGNVVEGMAHLWMAFSPLNRDFSGWLLNISREFNDWAKGLSQTQGFQEFIAYVRDNGPRVAEAMGAIANAVLQIVEAAAPLGGPVLHAITTLANALADIANSPLGTPIMAAVTAMSALSLAGSAATYAIKRLDVAMAFLDTSGAGAAAALSAEAAAATAAATANEAAAASSGSASKSLAAMGVTSGVAGLGLVALVSEILATKDAIGRLTDGKVTFADLGQSIFETLSPAGYLARALGLMPDVSNKATDAIDGTSSALDKYHKDAAHAQAATDALHTSLFRSQKRMLASASAADRLGKVIQAQNQEIADAASGWFDYSQKVKLGTTSIDDLINRWHKLGEAAANEGKNIRAALKSGIDPQVIRNIIKTLGPVGAAGAISDLAHVSKDRAGEINKAFGVMSSGARGFKGALRDVDEEMTHARARLAAVQQRMEHLQKPKLDVDTTGLEGGVKRADRLLVGFSHRPPAKPKVDVDDANFNNGVASDERLLLGFSHKKATPHIDVQSNAQQAAAAAQAALNSVHDKVVHITTVFTRENISIDRTTNHADGGFIRGPGGPRDDAIPAWLSNGEFVVNAATTARLRPWLEHENAKGFADGGHVGPPPTTGSGSADDAMTREARHTAMELKHLRAELKASSDAVDKERQQRDALVEKMKQLSTDIQGGLRSDLFGQSDVWASKFGGSSPFGVMSTLRGDIHSGHAEARAIRELKAKGLDGPALAEVLREGGLSGAQAFANLSRSKLAEYARLFNERNKVLHSVGSLGANAAFGGRLSDENRTLHAAERHLRAIQNEIHHLRKRNHQDHKDDQKAGQRGAGRGRRNQRKD